MDAVEQIKSRLPIEDLVGEYVQLQKAGRNLKGLCPFHSDHNPSFLVSPEKGIAWCFVCQSGGDVFEFFQKVEGIDFAEAVKILAEKTGVELPEYSKEKSDIKKQVQQVLEASLALYSEEFQKSQKAKDYWQSRQISEDVTQLFEVGYAPDDFSKEYSYLKKQGFSEEALTKSGNIIKKDGSRDEFFARFRNRLMIPIRDHNAKLIGFGGRIIEKSDDQAKYLNSPDSPLYNKSHILFGLDKAKSAIKEKGYAVILEGYMDVIASFEAGVKNAVAVSGVALTKEQLKLLKRYTNHLKLCFDQDSAGREATKRSIEMAAEEDFLLEVVILKNAKDTDELIKKGKELWEEALNHAVSPLDFFFLEAGERFRIDDVHEQKLFVNELLQRISNFPNVVLQQNYVKVLAEKCRLNPKLLLEELDKMKKNRGQKAQKISVTPVREKEKMTLEKYLLGMLCNHPHLFGILGKSLIFQVFEDAETKDIYKKCLETYNAQDKIPDFSFIFSPEENQKIRIWQLYAEEKNEYFSSEEWEKECKILIRNINEQNLKKSEQKILVEMRSHIPKEEQQKLALKLIEINKLKSAILP